MRSIEHIIDDINHFAMVITSDFNAEVNKNLDLENNYTQFVNHIIHLKKEFKDFPEYIRRLNKISKDVSGVYENYTKRTKVIE